MRQGTQVCLICFLQVGLVVPSGHAHMFHFESETLIRAADVNIPPSVYSVDVNVNGQDETDILSHHSIGQSVAYHNGTCTEPVFSDYIRLASKEGLLDDLSETFRIRPLVTDWTVDDYPDILARTSDTKVYLHHGIPEPTTLFVIMSTAGLLILRRRRRTA